MMMKEGRQRSSRSRCVVTGGSREDNVKITRSDGRSRLAAPPGDRRWRKLTAAFTQVVFRADKQQTPRQHVNQ